MLLIEEPPGSTTDLPAGRTGVKGWLQTAIVDPFRDFIDRRGMEVAAAILAFISIYKACDVLLTLMANPFYIDIGFSKTEIAVVSGTFGLFMTLAGGLIGGVLVFRFGIMRALIVGAILQAASNLMFALLAVAGAKLPVFVATIAVENVSGGTRHLSLRGLPLEPLQPSLHGLSVRAPDLLHAALGEVSHRSCKRVSGRCRGLADLLSELDAACAARPAASVVASAAGCQRAERTGDWGRLVIDT